MNVELATLEKMPQILDIYAAARAYMRENGNMEQWGGNYPAVEDVRSDIEAGHLYLCTEGDEIYGVFCYFVGEEPTYRSIYGGAWLNDLPYGVMHRVAVARHQRGVASFCFSHCYDLCKNLKIDTHRDNIPMQKCLIRAGFEYCGAVYLPDGTERLAYQKTK